jgi:hypothetical protein
MARNLRAQSTLRHSVMLFRALMLTCALAAFAPAARAQTAPLWGVYLCQTSILDIANDPSALLFNGQYPPASATNPAGACNTTTIQTSSLTNSVDSGSYLGKGPGYSDNGEVSYSGTAALGTLSASMVASAGANAGIATTQALESQGWFDTFTITSSTPSIPKGTAVTLNITVTYSGKIFLTTSGLSNVYMQFLDYNSGTSPVPLQIAAPGISLSSLDGTTTTSATLQVHTGDVVQLGARMNTQVLAAVGGFLNSEASIGAADSLLPLSNPDFTFTVNIDPIQPCISYTTASQTTYFSGLSPLPCSGPPTCAQIVAKPAVETATGFGETPTTDIPEGALPIEIGAQFKPNFGYTLKQAAAICGFDHFNFQQVVTGYSGALPATCASQHPTVPTLDPPPSGWEYQGCDNSYPYYYGQLDLASGPIPSSCPLPATGSGDPSVVQSDSALTFCDGPVNPGITSGVDSFWTALVGVNAAGQPVGAPTPNNATLTPLWVMTWTDSFNGMAAGGIMGPFLSGIFSAPPPDPTTGTGGIVILNSGAPLVGDVNGDGVVNCADLAVVKASFGKKLGQAGFDPRADVNFDGVVNIIDLSTVARALPAGSVCD